MSMYMYRHIHDKLTALMTLMSILNHIIIIHMHDTSVTL